MKYLKLPGLEEEVSRLILGTLHLHRAPPAVAERLLVGWVSAGGNCIDTARDYGAGEGERVLSRLLRAIGADRTQLIITKGGHPDARRTRRLNAADIRSDVERSLYALEREVIDLYLLHRDDPGVPVDEIIDILEGLKRDGHIRAYGASNWTVQRLEAALAYASAHRLSGFSCSSPNLSLAVQNEPAWPGCVSASDMESRSWYEKTQLPLLAWSAQAGGFFTGTYSPADRSHKDMTRVYFSDENWRRFDRARQLAEVKNCTAHEVALAWVLHQSFPTYAVIGPSSVAELNPSVAALQVELTQEEVRWLNLEKSDLVESEQVHALATRPTRTDRS